MGVPWDQPGADPMGDMRATISGFVERAARERAQNLEGLVREAIHLQDPAKYGRLHLAALSWPQSDGFWPASITDLGLEWPIQGSDPAKIAGAAAALPGDEG